MKVIAKRSSDVIFGMIIGLSIILVSFICTVLLGSASIATAFILPEFVGAIMVIFYGSQLAKTPYELILYDEEKKNLIIKQGKNEDITIPLKELTNMYQNSSGLRRNYTGSLSLITNDDCVYVSNVANSKNVALEIEKLKHEADEYVDEKLKYFEKL